MSVEARHAMVDVACSANTRDLLGEVPRWHQIEQALYWIDALKPAIHRLDPAAGRVESWTPPEKLGSLRRVRTTG